MSARFSASNAGRFSRSLLVAPLLVISLALAACSGDDDPAQPDPVGLDAGIVALDASEGGFDASGLHPDASEACPDASESRLDASEALPDASDVRLDASEALPDASDVRLDASEALPDASDPLPDASTVLPDASAQLPDASVARPDASMLLPDAGEPLGTIEFSPSSAEQGASRVAVNAVTSLALNPADFTVMIDPRSGAAIFDAEVTGDHFFRFVLEVASEAPVGLWEVTAESRDQRAAGSFEIVQKQIIEKTLEFVPTTLARGQTTAVALQTQNIELYSTLEVSFPPESGILVQGLAVDGSGSEATMELQVDGAAPLGEVMSTVANGAQEYHPKITVIDAAVGGLRFDEVMPVPSSLPAGYVELVNTGATSLSTAGWTLVVEGAATVTLPERTVEAGKRLLLASGAGVPGGAFVVEGLVFPMTQGRLVLRDATGEQRDAVRWDLADAGCAARLGIAMERVDVAVSGEVSSNWVSARALVQAPGQVEDWAGDRGSPGLPSFVSVEADPLEIGAEVTMDLAGRTTLLHHALTVDHGTWLALQADVDRIAGYASTALFAVDTATGAAFSPSYVTSDFGDSVAMIEVPAGSGASATMDVRIWPDPVESFEPSRYTARAAAPSGLKANPVSLALLPEETRQVEASVVFDAVAVDGEPLTLPVDPAKLEFRPQDATIATVDSAGLVTALQPGSTIITVTLAQPDGPRVVEVPVRVGDNSGNGETCDVAIDVTAGAHLTGQSTLGAVDDYDPRDNGAHCPAGFTDADRVYVVTPTVATNYRVTVTPEGQFDPILYAVTDCAMQECVAGTALWGPGQAETISFQAPAGTSVFIVVDGMGSAIVSKGNFTLDVVVQSR